MTERKEHTLLDFGVEIRLCPAPKPPETLPTATPSAVPVCVAPQKRNILDIPIPTRKDNGRMLTTIRADLRQAARKDYRKNGISHEVISQPIMLENRYSCSDCGKYSDCLKIDYLKLMAAIKEAYPRKRKNNVNPDPLRVLWKLYRICQRNCAIKKACYRENEKRLEELQKTNMKGYMEMHMRIYLRSRQNFKNKLWKRIQKTHTKNLLKCHMRIGWKSRRNSKNKMRISISNLSPLLKPSMKLKLLYSAFSQYITRRTLVIQGTSCADLRLIGLAVIFWLFVNHTCSGISGLSFFKI